NVTMRTSRLELLQARINLDTVMLAWEEEQLTAKYITEEVIKEHIRQAGILGMTVPSRSQLETLAKAVLLSDVSGATFSDRIWANQNELRNEVNQAIERALIRGEHPRKSAANIKRLIRNEYGKKQRAAERILITEVARAQSTAAKESFKKAGVEHYTWISEPDACPECAKLDGKVFKLGANYNPMPPDPHPNCRCSISGHVPDEE